MNITILISGDEFMALILLLGVLAVFIIGYRFQTYNLKQGDK